MVVALSLKVTSLLLTITTLTSWFLRLNVIVVSVDYRLAPKHHLLSAFDDSWTALKWVASHVNGDGPKDWLNSHADFNRMFLVGDSASATITHQMAMKCGQEKLPGIKIKGIILACPYFWGKELLENEVREEEIHGKIESLWLFQCPKSSGVDDPLINPIVDPNLASLGCNKVLVFVAGKDMFRKRGWHYYENLKNCGWKGEVEIMEAEEEHHVFHLSNATCENSIAMLRKITSFINQGGNV